MAAEKTFLIVVETKERHEFTVRARSGQEAAMKAGGKMSDPAFLDSDEYTTKVLDTIIHQPKIVKDEVAEQESLGFAEAPATEPPT